MQQPTHHDLLMRGGTVIDGTRAPRFVGDVGDATTIRDVATYATPTRPAEGMDTVVVNGCIAWRHGRHTGARSGQVLARTPPARSPA